MKENKWDFLGCLGNWVEQSNNKIKLRHFWTVDTGWWDYESQSCTCADLLTNMFEHFYSDINDKFLKKMKQMTGNWWFGVFLREIRK